MQYALSIIVPVYNTEPYLARCVDSILGQSFADFELLTGVVPFVMPSRRRTVASVFSTKRMVE